MIIIHGHGIIFLRYRKHNKACNADSFKGIELFKRSRYILTLYPPVLCTEKMKI